MKVTYKKYTGATLKRDGVFGLRKFVDDLPEDNPTLKFTCSTNTDGEIYLYAQWETILKHNYTVSSQKPVAKRDTEDDSPLYFGIESLPDLPKHLPDNHEIIIKIDGEY